MSAKVQKLLLACLICLSLMAGLGWLIHYLINL
jgi:hypothetical protein